jgi:hypothetical protein
MGAPNLYPVDLGASFRPSAAMARAQRAQIHTLNNISDTGTGVPFQDSLTATLSHLGGQGGRIDPTLKRCCNGS